MRTILLDKVWNELSRAAGRGDSRKFSEMSYVILHKLNFLTSEENDYLWGKIRQKWSLSTIERYATQYQTPPPPEPRGAMQQSEIRVTSSLAMDAFERAFRTRRYGNGNGNPPRDEIEFLIDDVNVSARGTSEVNQSNNEDTDIESNR